MSDDDPLDALSSKELHDLAVRYALRHLDIAFLIRLMRALPVAEAAVGEIDEAEADALTLRAHLDDLTDSGEGEVAELLRPLYVAYLREHGVTPPLERGRASPKPARYRPVIDHRCTAMSPGCVSTWGGLNTPDHRDWPRTRRLARGPAERRSAPAEWVIRRSAETSASATPRWATSSARSAAVNVR